MATTAETLAAAVSTFEELVFNKFDRLHSVGINDDDVIHFLRGEGHTLLAERYIEWSGALDPDRENNATTSPDGVTDPGNSDTNKLIAESYKISVVTALLADGLRQLCGTVWEPYLDLKDTTDAVIDGHIDLTAVARHIVKGLGK